MTDSSRLAPPFIATTADVASDATIGDGTAIWGETQVREGAAVGSECVVGRGAYIDHHVVIGERCKIQNLALVYAPARIGDGVFIGPAAILANDPYPRAVTPSGDLKRPDDWTPLGVTVDGGASIGAKATVLGGVHIGAWSMVGAGAVVTKDVPAHALVVGTPARRVGWVGADGRRLVAHPSGVLADPSTGLRYREQNDRLEVVE